jgi:ubiquinone/menaquinone biosynthesis C-methylase UbiE
MGGRKATEELAELCRIDEGKYILEVGCGIGMTACYLAKRWGCRVAGVDISERMIDWCNTRAKRAGVEDRVEFRMADARDLPFEDALFDAVICESVTAFPEDKRRAVSEYVRVTRPGGCVGLNEGTWIKTTPPAELVEYIDRTMAQAKFLTPGGWKELLEGSGLTDVVVRTYKLNALSQWVDEMRGVGFRDLTDRLRALNSFLSMVIKSPAFRKYAKEMTPSPKIIKSLFTYLGYGIYVGRK